MATKAAVIVLNQKEIFIWAIPPLSPQPPDFFDHHPTYIPPHFIISILDDIEITSEFLRWTTLDSWYFGSSQPLYCELLCPDFIHRFQIVIGPDLITASLRAINTSPISPHDPRQIYFPPLMICKDTLVACIIDSDVDEYENLTVTGIYTGLTTPNGIISHGGPAANMLLPDIGCAYDLFPCPASGRFVRVDNFDESDSIVILDFF